MHKTALRCMVLMLIIGASAGTVDLQPGGHPPLLNMSYPVIMPGTKMPIDASLCVEGSEQVFKQYDAQGLGPVYMYRSPNEYSQGHVWIAVPDGDKWLAIDSYWGPMESASYYTADGMYGNMTMLQKAFPREPA